MGGSGMGQHMIIPSSNNPHPSFHHTITPMITKMDYLLLVKTTTEQQENINLSTYYVPYLWNIDLSMHQFLLKCSILMEHTNFTITSRMLVYLQKLTTVMSRLIYIPKNTYNGLQWLTFFGTSGHDYQTLVNRLDLYH